MAKNNAKKLQLHGAFFKELPAIPDFVKSVNGAAPDENGNVEIDKAFPVLITHLAFPGFADIKCNKTCDEIHLGVLNQNVNAASITLLLYTAMTKAEEYRYCKNIVLEKNEAKEFTKRYILYFGEDIAPYIVDVNTNTITLDPDWVAPAHPLTEDDVNSLIDAKLGVIENGTY